MLLNKFFQKMNWILSETNICPVIIVIIISYFHQNQLPIYDINLAAKFILNKQKSNDFGKISKALGYEPTDKLLIIHADDVGLCKSVNTATFESFKNKSISSAAVMLTTLSLIHI